MSDNITTNGCTALSLSQGPEKTIPEEFPKNFSDLDAFLTRDVYGTMQPGVKGYNDVKYRSFRRKCVQITNMYKLGTPIPTVHYPQYQVKAWTRTFSRLKELYPTHACTKFNRLFQTYVEACGISADEIPDLEKISNYLKRKTGFRLRPVSCYMAPRDFLAALAFRVFCSSQYVRHDDGVFFNNEPDIIHEIFGHGVLLCDPEFARFSQEIGLASLGTPDHILEKIASVYLNIVEAGLCWDGNNIKAYGALLLSGANELEHVFTEKAVKRPLEMEAAASLSEISLDKYQDVYYVSESIDAAQQLARAYMNTLPHRLPVCYNPDTNTIEQQGQDN